MGASSSDDASIDLLAPVPPLYTGDIDNRPSARLPSRTLVSDCGRLTKFYTFFALWYRSGFQSGSDTTAGVILPVPLPAGEEIMMVGFGEME